MMKVDVVSVQKVERGYDRRKNQSKKEGRENVERGRERASEKERERERERESESERERESGERERGEKDRENLKIVRFTQLQFFS